MRGTEFERRSVRGVKLDTVVSEKGESFIRYVQTNDFPWCKVTVFFRMPPFFSSQSHGITARSFPTLRTGKSIYSQRSMKTCPLSQQTCPLLEKTPQVFSPLAPLPFSPPPSLARVGAPARTRTQRVFIFYLHRTAICA